MLEDQLIALNFRVQAWESFERPYHCFGEEGHEAKRNIMPLLEGFLTPATHLHNGTHVDLIKGCQHSRRLLRLNQALGNRLPPP